ncbi:MAG: hypothetical protein IJG08_08620 [Oscillospiraceae bacterium]|nr:hypothetical protein [Oscillospiraceae bacterium]
MKEERIIHALGDISPRYIDEAAPGAARKPVRVRWELGALAACIGLLAVLGLPRLLPPKGSVDPAAETAAPALETPESAAPLTMRTSDRYQTLPELLDFLGGREVHDSRMSDGSGGNEVPAACQESAEEAALTENTGVALSADGRYAYHLGMEEVVISRLDGTETQRVSALPLSASAVFSWENTLFLLSEDLGGVAESADEPSVRVCLYDISAPEVPVLREVYRQRGSLTACFLRGGDLCFVTRDGVCACGWSRLSDPSGYYPSLTRQGEALPWGDAEIAILGAPSRVQYCAVTVLDGASGAVKVKTALYGDILKLFYGADWLAVTVAAETETGRENPVVYTFDTALRFTGSIRPAETLNVAETNPAVDWMPQDGTYLSLVSVSKAGSVYRLLGSCWERRSGQQSASFLAMAANPVSGAAEAALLPAEDYPGGAYTEILWEADRAVACVSVTQRVLSPVLHQETRFLFAEFDGLDIRFYENELRADNLSGRLGVSYGNPLGQFCTLVPLGDGIYARYTGPSDQPGGFEVYDFSDSAAPRKLSAGDLRSSGEALDYLWYVYGPQRFGTLVVKLGPADAFRDVSLSWRVCAVRSDGSLEVERDVPLGGTVKTFFGADSLGLSVFPAGGQLYCAAPHLDAPVPLGACG